MKENHVRVVDTVPDPFPDEEVVVGRSRAQELRESILDETMTRLQTAMAETEEALELFGLLTVPQHKNLATLIQQQLEQVVEYRRLHP